MRIADASRVRLGAHLAEGTTVMHEGFCNFNAGTLGTSMVEGRISQGVVVGDGSDVGGGASIMGTLSGGGTDRITIGERCLLGANSGIGISLGDDCVVEAGLYVTAGTLVKLPDGQVVKGRDLSGISVMTFIRHSQTGAVEFGRGRRARGRPQRRPAPQLIGVCCQRSVQLCRMSPAACHSIDETLRIVRSRPDSGHLSAQWIDNEVPSWDCVPGTRRRRVETANGDGSDGDVASEHQQRGYTT